MLARRLAWVSRRCGSVRRRMLAARRAARARCSSRRVARDGSATRTSGIACRARSTATARAKSAQNRNRVPAPRAIASPGRRARRLRSDGASRASARRRRHACAPVARERRARPNGSQYVARDAGLSHFAMQRRTRRLRTARSVRTRVANSRGRAPNVERAISGLVAVALRCTGLAAPRVESRSIAVRRSMRHRVFRQAAGSWA
ncbi:hypothetical protein R69658_02674 [Paraburkholderia aspalathi]|uniref:Uncharacterized protein n=1 Tax=Paraburkholderia aspalathi TaxID=1324617 RepID=A0ABN7LH50_9BURK|nr:hypothetical protein R69658_02674 [Paraburkholderia aspalathi]